MKGTFHKSITVPVMLIIILGIYVAAICLINFFAPPSFYDSDMYTDIRYSMEAWNHKSVFPEGWVFGNQLYVASSPVLAAVLYGMTGSPHIAMGLASTVMALLVLMSFHWMLLPMITSRPARMVGSVLFMGTMLLFNDAWHDTGGWQLMFTMCSYYACYAINVFLAYGCYLRSERLKFRDAAMVLLVLICVLSFCTGIQSLRQTAVMTLPLLGTECLRILCCMIRKQTADKKPLIVAGCVSAANVAGVVTARCMQLEQLEIFGEMGLSPLSEYLPNLRSGVLQVLSLVIDYDAAGYAMLSGILLFCGIAFLRILIQAVRGENWKCLALLVLLVLSVAVILAVDVMLTMLVRPIYYFMLFPLLAFLGSCFYSGSGKWGRRVLLIFLAVLFLMSFMQELMPAAFRILQKEEEPAYEVSEYLQENGYTTLYGAWNQGADVVIASGWTLSAGFWEYQEDPFFYYKYLCNPEIFRADSEKCVYLFYGQEDAQLAVAKARTKEIEMTLLKHFPDSDIYLYTASENIMEAFW